jgi:hypothetical protein
MNTRIKTKLINAYKVTVRVFIGELAHNEECTCNYCGFPMYTGDEVVMAEDWDYGTPYCSTGCAGKDY